MNIRRRIENMFESWSLVVVHHRWKVLIMTLALTLSVIPQIRHGWVDISIESMLPAENAALSSYNDFRMNFNYAPVALLIIELDDSAFSKKNLNKLIKLHEHVDQNTPYLSDVKSLFNARYTLGDEEGMVTGDLSEIWPETAEEMISFRQFVLSNSNYMGNFISHDEKLLSIIIDPLIFDPKNSHPNEHGFTYLQAGEEGEFTKSVYDLAKTFSSPGFKVRNAGGPTMNYSIAKDMESSTGRSIGLGMMIIIVLLSLLFRRASGVLLPLLVVALSLMMTLAIWPLLNYPYNGNTQIIPTFLLAVGIADAIHILSIFYKYYDDGMEKNAAITKAVSETAIAVLLTTITTAAGLLSFTASSIMPTFTMGLFGALGVIMALFYTLALVPSILSILPIKRHAQATTKNSASTSEKPSIILHWVDRTIDAFAYTGIHHAKKVVSVSLLLSAIAFIGLVNTRLEHDPLSWYPEGHELRDSIQLIDERMNGSMSAYILLDTQEKQGLYNPEILNAIEEIETLIKNYHYKDIDAKEVTSILSVVKETHQALNNNQAEFFSIPQQREIVAQELLLFESGSDDIYDFADFDLQTARFNIQLKWSNILYYREYTKLLTTEIENKLAELQLEHVQFEVIGLLPIFGETLYALLVETIESYIIAFVLVFIIMVMLMGTLRGGIIAFIPNIFPILITVGIIGLLDVPLNIITSTIGCIIIGISVDDTIHFMHHFQRYAQSHKDSDIETIIHKTLQTCGRAIFFTSVVLVGGFIVHLTGELSTNKEFGWILSLSIVIALLANLILAPALLTLFWKKKT